MDARVEEEPRAVIILVVTICSCCLVFLQFSVFCVGGLSIHNNFSTSAVFRAKGERGSDRNRVTYYTGCHGHAALESRGQGQLADFLSARRKRGKLK